MHPTDNTQPQGSSEDPGWDRIRRVEQELLIRVREVAQEITRRVRKALGEDHPDAPPDPPEGPPPLS
jgi:hypothetical protein